MRLPRGGSWTRIGAGAALAVAASSFSVLGGTAHAEEAGADLAVSVAGTTVVKDAGKPFFIRLHNNGPATATGIKLTIDISKLDQKKIVAVLPGLGGGCVADSDTKATCPLPDLAAGGNDSGIDASGLNAVLVQSIKGTGNAGSFTVSVESDSHDPNPSNNKVTTKVGVAKSGIDLTTYAQDVYSTVEGTDPVQPGKTGELFWLLANVGANPVKGVEYSVTLPPYLTFETKDPLCTYNAANNVATCKNPDVILRPGEALSDGADESAGRTLVKLAATAPGPVALTGGIVTGRGLAELREEPAPSALAQSKAQAKSNGTAVLQAAEAQKRKKPAKAKDVDPTDNAAPFSVFTAANPADLGISAAPVSGHVGETVTVKVIVTNAGPADAIKAKVKVTAPAGTEFVSVDPTCVAATAGKEYACDLGTAPKGMNDSGDFSLKILSATVADGKAEVSSAVADPNVANNTAAIKVTVVPGPAPSTPGATPSTPAGGTGGGLPVTGSQAGLIGGLGLGAVAVGGVLMVLARRRRAVVIPPTD
jgi:uncharacterized repeat protein (TIGR01451 family)